MNDKAEHSRNRKIMQSSARKVVFNVFKVCSAESEAGRFVSNYRDPHLQTAVLTGLSESTVRRIVTEGVENKGIFSTPGKCKKGRPQKEFDDFNKCALRQAIQSFYTVRKEVPTLRKLLQYVKNELEFECSLMYLRKIILNIGFKYKKCQSERSALIETYYIAAKRDKYLSTLKQNRELPPELQKPVIYLDESYIHQSYKVRKCWQSFDIQGVKEKVSKGKRYIIVHAGSEKGFIPNCLLIFSGNNQKEDYHSEMNSHNFSKWVMEKLIPNLQEPSIIVLDNAPYHSIVTNKAPNSSTKVNDIKMWLLENNISFDPNLKKPSLLMLVKKNKPDPIYYIDQVLGEHGHTVVRPYHCDLNPIELIWAQAKKKIAGKNVGDGRDIKNIAEEAFNEITAEDWSNCCKHVIKLEEEYLEREKFLYGNMEQFIIQVNESDSSEPDISDYEDDEVSDNEGEAGPSRSKETEDYIEVEYLELSSD